MTTIHEALAAVMADVDHVAKRDRNEQQKFLFRGVDAVVNAVGPVLRKHRVIVVPSVEHVEYAAITSRNGGSLTSCRLIATYTFYADDGSSLASKVAAEAFDSGDKATPKAMSVAFRTALLQALALPTDDPEPDAQTYTASAPASEPRAENAGVTRRMSRETSGVTKPQMDLLQGQFGRAGITDRAEKLAFCARTIGREIGSANDLTKSEASKVIDALKAITDEGDAS